MRSYGVWLAASWFAVVVAMLGGVAPAMAQSFPLEEPVSDTRVFHVTCKMTVTGQLEAALGGGKSKTLPLKADATMRYYERRLSAAGRDSEALRSIRSYETAESSIEVEKTPSSSRLSDARRRIVAQGRREGVMRYCLDAPMTRSEIELLTVPGDSLALLGLLPRNNVEKGETWRPESWVLQTLAGVDAVVKSDLSCDLVSSNDEVATFRIQGKIEGATVGAATTVTIDGTCRYDRKAKHIRSLELEQKEKRSVGAVSPGMDVVAKVSLERKVAGGSNPLSELDVEKVPLEPDVGLLVLGFESPWGLRATHDRDWHVFHQTSDAAILRLLEKGALVAQCNLRKIAPAAPGKHTPEEQFQADIQKVLGEQFKAFAGAEQIKTDDGRFLYRVTVEGVSKPAADSTTAKPLSMKWIYYLCAAPTGEQCSLVFAVQTDLVEKLANRDLTIVKSLKFPQPPAK